MNTCYFWAVKAFVVNQMLTMPNVAIRYYKYACLRCYQIVVKKLDRPNRTCMYAMNISTKTRQLWRENIWSMLIFNSGISFRPVIDWAIWFLANFFFIANKEEIPYWLINCCLVFLYILVYFNLFSLRWKMIPPMGSIYDDKTVYFCYRWYSIWFIKRIGTLYHSLYDTSQMFA